MLELAIVAAVRTPIGRYGGALARKSAVDLGVAAVQAALSQSRVPAEAVDMLVLGLARQAGCGPNPGRQVGVRAGLPLRTTAYTLNQACASGLSSILAAARHIRCGEADIVVAAGAESMSNVPYLLDKARFGQKMGHQQLLDAMYRDGLFCPLAGMIMGETVEALAGELSISREAQDEYALESQRRCARAVSEGAFASQLVALPELAADEHPRAETSLASLAKLPPVFGKNGTITAGNSSGITDGASAVIVASKEAVEKHGLHPLAYFEQGVLVGLEPERMGLGPVPAMAALEQRTGRAAEAYDLLEVNEAFAAQVLACHQQRPLPFERTNVNGGSIALGHPIGCSGNRVVVTLLHEMARRNARLGLASLCVSGGLGIAASFRRQP